MASKLEKIIGELQRRQGLSQLKDQWKEYRDPSIRATQDDPWMYIPQKPTELQQKFLDLTCKEALYGGAAGGGKSSALLMNALQWVHVPGYSALILRKSFTDLTMSGGLMDRTHDWLAPTAATFSAGKMCWTFPSGARLFFGHLADDGALDKYQGAHFHFIGFDELTQHPERRYTYLLSRNRRQKTESDLLPEIMRATSNPGGVGHDWVYKRFIKPYAAGQVTTDNYQYTDCVFVPAKLDDNPYLDQEAYRASLMRMDGLTRRQLLEGDWEATPSDLMFPLSEAHVLDELSDEFMATLETVLSVDLGTREDAPTTAFVLLGWSRTRPNRVWILSAYKFAGMTPSQIGKYIQAVMQSYDVNRVIMDQGGLGKGYIREMRFRYGIPAEPVQKADKLGYRKLLIGAFENGYVQLVGPECEDLLEELHTLRWNEKGTDNLSNQANHATDALLYGYRHAMAYMSEPDQEQPNVFDANAWAAQQEQEDIREAIKKEQDEWKEFEEQMEYEEYF